MHPASAADWRSEIAASARRYPDQLDYPRTRQGCQIGFLSQIPEIFFFFFLNFVGVTKFIWLFGFFLAFYVLKLTARKLHTILFLNNFLLRKMFFLASYIWQYFCYQELGQEGASRQRVSRLNTVDTKHIWGSSLQFVSDLRSVWM